MTVVKEESTMRFQYGKHDEISRGPLLFVADTGLLC